MRYHNVYIEAFGYHLPETILSSEQLEKKIANLYEKLDYSPGRLEALSGIKERRLWPVGTRPSDVAAVAGRSALEKLDFDTRKIGAVIHTGVCRDMMEPATSVFVHESLGLDANCAVFDISNACLGFVNGMFMAANMIELGQIEAALIVSGENAAPVYEDTIKMLNEEQNMTDLHFKQHIANFTLGSGAMACVLTNSKLSSSRHQILGGVFQNNTNAADFCKASGDNQNQMMHTNTKELMKHGIILTSVTWELFKREMRWQDADVDQFATHQISIQHQTKVYEALGLDIKKDNPTFQHLGNTGSVAAPISLAMAVEKGRVKEGDNVCVMGIGSGLNCFMMGVNW